VPRPNEMCHAVACVTTTSNTLRASRTLSALSLLWLAGCSSPSESNEPTAGITVSPANEVRQGQSNVVISVEHPAGGLSNVTRVDLGDLQAVVDPSSSDDHLLLAVTIPHGAPPGPRTLSIDSASGTTTDNDALTVTPITVAPDGQDTQLGTPSSPFHSLMQALAVAGPGDTCVLGQGTYREQTGETWGYAVPEPLTIIGDAAGTTLLQGPARTTPEPTNPDRAAFEPSAALTLEHLALADFDVALDVQRPAQLALEDVAIRGNGKGVVLDASGSTVKLDGGSIDTGAYGLEIASACDGCTLDIEGSTLTESSENPLIQVADAAQHSVLTFAHADLKGGVFVADPEATLSIAASKLEGNAENAALNFGGLEFDATDSTFSAGPAPYGINIHGGTMQLANVTVQGNEYSVYQLAGTSKVRGSHFTGYSSIGFYFAKGDLDLGTATDAGNNTFVAADSGGFGLYVDTDTTPLTCSNTSFDGVIPKTGSVTADTEILTEPHEFLLVPGRTISFFNVP
jgi:hypothetical protein